MAKREIAGIVLPAHFKRHNMVNIKGLFVND